MSLRRLAAVSLAAALLLGGCSDEPEPRFEEPSESATPTEAATSEAAAEQTPEEFIREWVELDIAMQNSGKTEPYLAVSSQCGSCRDFAKRIAEVYEAGGYVQTDGWRIEEINRVAARRYQVLVDSRPTVVVAREGGKEERFEGGTVTYELVLEGEATTWQVVDWYEVAM